LVEGLLEGVQILGPEDLREGAHREEEVRVGGDPSRALWGEGAAGDEAMKVDVLAEVLAPGVQDGGDAEIASQVLGIAREGLKRFGRRLEEEMVDQARLVLGEMVESMGEREDDVEVGDGQQLSASVLDPALLGEGLALGAVAIAAGVVDGPRGAAAVTGLPMSAEGGGATGLDGAEGAALDGGQDLHSANVVAVDADDVRQLGLEAPARRRRPRRRRAGHGSAVRGLREIEQVEGRATVGDVLSSEMEVAHCGADVAMSEQALDRVEVGSGLEQVRGEGVTKSMDATRLGDPCAALGSGVDALRGAVVHGAAAIARGEQPGPGALELPVVTQLAEEAL